MLGGCHVQPEQFFNLIFGYYDRVLEYSIDYNAAAGYNVKYSNTPPAGEIWIITAAHTKNITRANNMAISVVDAAAGYVTAKSGSTSVAGEALSWSGTIVLKAGDKIKYEWGNAVAGDDIDWGCNGYKMKISQ